MALLSPAQPETQPSPAYEVRGFSDQHFKNKVEMVSLRDDNESHVIHSTFIQGEEPLRDDS